MKAKTLTILTLAAVLSPAACQSTDAAGPELKKALIEATCSAVNQELKSYRTKLAEAEGGLGPRENVEKYKVRIAALEAERDRFLNMTPDEYPAPSDQGKTDGIFSGPDDVGPVVPAFKRTIPVLVRNTYASGSLLDVEGASRSGPFYRLAGIKGGCVCVLKKNVHYDLTVYIVYRREYFGFIKDYYVYVADLGDRPAGPQEDAGLEK
ncbi:MAG: hypothetical protein JXD23_16880 [Spirochaetales bacterium]|nr:hypothetical protein [Spirochaetales bacterium]